MKKPVSILLIGLLLFNWFGYRLLIAFIESRENTALEARLDEDKYDESQLISVKIPMRYLPYASNSAAFERVDGEIEIGGIPYKYVKRRIYNDSLEMLCIPNQTAIKWQSAKNEFFRFVNDLQHEKKSPSRSSSAKSLSTGDYIQEGTLRVTAGFPCPVSSAYISYAAELSLRHLPAEEHPPQCA
jgi:hypothetical protein